MINVASAFDQDWTSLENLCKELKIDNYQINRWTNKKSQSRGSVLIINRADNILKFYHYLFSGKTNFGMKRKLKKFRSFEKLLKEHLHNNSCGMKGLSRVYSQQFLHFKSQNNKIIPIKSYLSLKDAIKGIYNLEEKTPL